MSATETDRPKPTALAVNPDGIPEELKALRRWVTWRYQWRDGKWTKPPLNARTGKAGSATDPATWTTYEEALAAYQGGLPDLDGIGFALTAYQKGTRVLIGEAVPYVGIDFDHCVDPETGAIAEWAIRWIRHFNSYTERSPSGTGIRIFVRGKLPPGGRTKPKLGIEVYDNGKYLTLTGRRVEVSP